MQFYNHLITILKGLEKYSSDGKLLKNLIVEDALKLDSELISLLHNDPVIREKFFEKIGGGYFSVRQDQIPKICH